MRRLLALLLLLTTATALSAQDGAKSNKPADKKLADKKLPDKNPASADPLSGLAAAVELPPVTPAEKWGTLAKISIPEKFIVLFNLVRSEQCLGAARKVELKELDGGRSWRCVVTERAGAEPTPIATFRLTKDQLQFAWTAEAAQVFNAGALKNGSFEIAVGPSKKTVALRKTVKGSSLPLSLEEPTTVYLEIPDPPRLDSIRIELDMPSAEFKGRRVSWRLLLDGPALKANGGTAWAEAIRPPHLAVKIDSSFAKTLRVTATPMFWGTNREKPQRLSAKNLSAAIAELSAYQAKLNAARGSIPKAKTLPPAVKLQVDALAKELAIVRKTSADLESLQEFVKEIKLGNIHLKVFQEVEGHTATLLTTK